ncbi:MAG: hypothetical protein ABIA74_05475 [bacterium]
MKSLALILFLIVLNSYLFGNFLKKESHLVFNGWNVQRLQINTQIFNDLKNAINNQDISLVGELLSLIQNEFKIVYYIEDYEPGLPLIHKVINTGNYYFISFFLNQLNSVEEIKFVLICNAGNGQTALKAIFKKGWEFRIHLLAESIQKKFLKVAKVLEEIILEEKIRPEILSN